MLRLNGNQLKLIAVISMLIDHVAFTLYPFVFMGNPAGEFLYDVMRGIGRIAFPVYAFMLAEGFFHTRSWTKYALRMFICALISEIPYNYMIGGSWQFAAAQNIFWTLLLGICMMRLWQLLLVRYPGTIGRQMQLVILVICCMLAWIFRMDYDYRGIMLIGLLCWFYGDLKHQCLFGAVWMIGTVGLSGYWMCFGYIAAFLLIFCYSGEKGRWNGKAFFYGFYPVHLVILDVAAALFR